MSALYPRSLSRFTRALRAPAPTAPVYTRAVHGVHFAGSLAPRDVEHWTVPQAVDSPRHPGVPADAERVSSTYRDGVTYALYVRWAPATACPSCPTCSARRSP